MLNTIRNQIERSIAGDNIIKDIRNLFRLKKKIGNGIKDEALREIRTLFESDEDVYYKPVKIISAFDNNFVGYESNGDKDKALSIGEYLNETKPYLSDMINDLKIQEE